MEYLRIGQRFPFGLSKLCKAPNSKKRAQLQTRATVQHQQRKGVKPKRQKSKKDDYIIY
jgi:hypothetical protein